MLSMTSCLYFDRYSRAADMPRINNDQFPQMFAPDNSEASDRSF